MTRVSRGVIALLVCGALFGAAAPGRAQGDTAAVAINTRDGTSIFRFMFHIRRVMNETVDQSNAAVAYASCSECQTVALSIQVLLLMGDPNVVTPENLALALNYDCTSCETLASAYQYVFTTGGPVHFTADGNIALAEIRRQLRDLLRSDISIFEMQAGIDALNDELAVVLEEELVSAGPPEATAEETPEPTETSAGTEPSPDPESSPSAEASEEPSPEPEGSTSP